LLDDFERNTLHPGWADVLCKRFVIFNPWKESGPSRIRGNTPQGETVKLTEATGDPILLGKRTMVQEKSPIEESLVCARDRPYKTGRVRSGDTGT